MSKNLSLKTISLVIPAKNEKESLKKTLTELEKFKFIDEIIIVVDSRSDNSINIIKH
jgi:glycosyltransferase involved in cell wall biosynthesis